ncbi:MAG TPA: lysozyme inhibitor LprI family protein [Candidatus Methylomirabilis sp.]|nr:lysozyme inhibitor LprI family protein [Candidatus Methylomirabilis sp.]
MRFGMPVLGLTTILFSGYGIVPHVQQQESAKKITEEEIKRAINSQSDVNECESLDQIHVDHLEYHDFIGDGQQEAVVVASTCMTGTAGPDIHAVYKRDADGKVVELPFLDAKGDPPLPAGKDWRAWIFGNANYGLTVENGELVARWSDTSDRDSPAVAWYKWDGKKFVMDHMKVDGPFPASYDCAKATKELDRAICYSPSVAALDVQLGQAYRAALNQLPPDKKPELQSQQREWLAQREKGCTIYKWWVDCLKDLYTKRIAELKPGAPLAVVVRFLHPGRSYRGQWVHSNTLQLFHAIFIAPLALSLLAFAGTPPLVSKGGSVRTRDPFFCASPPVLMLSFLRFPASSPQFPASRPVRTDTI